MGDEEEHDRVKQLLSRCLENETCGNTNRVERSERAGDVNAENREANEEDDDEGEQEEDTVERAKGLSNVAHRSAEETAFAVSPD